MIRCRRSLSPVRAWQPVVGYCITSRSTRPTRANSVVFTGYQAGGTRGAAMVRGTESIKIHGQYWQVNAEIVNLDMLSAHADSEEIIEWLSHFEKPPTQVFIVHGEPEASDALRLKIAEHLGWDCTLPEMDHEYPL